MKKIIIAIVLFAAINSFGQKGVQFPDVSGKTLNDKYIGLPMKNNKSSVIGIAFNRAAEAELKKWLNPLYNTFIPKPGDNKNFDVAEIYDVNFVFIPMIAGLKKVVEDFKNSTDKEFWPYIMDTEKTDIKGLKEKLGITDDKIPYFFVLDKSGKILEAVNGKFTEEKMDKLEDAAE
jgi:hypothetical protein